MVASLTVVYYCSNSKNTNKFNRRKNVDQKQKIVQLQSLVDQFAKNENYYKSSKEKYNETSCRTEYIDRFLQILGWDVTNSQGKAPQYREVIAEYDLTDEGRPDYSLNLNGVPKIFVEAKKPAVDILTDKDPAFQARKYGWNAGHKIVILTNFKNLVLYDTTIVPHEGDSPTVARYKVYSYKDYVPKFSEITDLISKESVYSGKFDDWVNSESFINTSRAKEPVDKYFLKQINQWRVDLANELYKQENSYNSVEQLNDVVQEFINQIVFLRICEDQNLPLYHNLQQNIKEEGQLHQELERMFREADKRYNSGMFSGPNIIFDLSDKVIENIIEGLYYPQSPYMFNIIKPNILGKMYEMFLTEELTLSNGEIVLRPKEDCKNRSVVTTPDEIVRYMVDKSLKARCENKTPDEIKQIKIADISCGSGIFLEEAFSALQSYCIDWYFKNDKSHLEEVSGGKYKLPLDEKKEILINCIFGIDIDMHAVEVARFSLLLKLIEDETAPSVSSSKKILIDLSGNIFYGNALVDNEMLENLDLTLDEEMEMVPFDWSNMPQGGFDIILGNPPYVNTSDMRNLLPDKEVSYVYKNFYDTSCKQFDKYYIFIERAISKLAENGLLCYIVPNKFFTIESGKGLRNLIAENKLLISIDDFGDTQLFEGKTIYSSIIFLGKHAQTKFIYSGVHTIAALWDTSRVESVEISENSLHSTPWLLTTDIEFMNKFINVQQNSEPITKYVDIFNGIQTSAERPPIYWFKEKEIKKITDRVVTIERNNKRYTIERRILRPYFKPVKKNEKGLNTYSKLSTDKYIIFPYDANGKLIPISTMKKEFPGAMEYLQDNYAALVPKCVSSVGRRDVPGATKDTWYQYGRTQALTAFTNTPKLIVRILSKVPMYAFDDQDMLIASGGTAGYCAITKKEESPYELEYIQAWLTNQYTEKIVSLFGSNFENGFISRGTSVLKEIPFIPLDLNNTSQRKKYEKVVSTTKEIYAINNQLEEESLSKSSKQVLLRRKQILINTIDKIIKSIYEAGD